MHAGSVLVSAQQGDSGGCGGSGTAQETLAMCRTGGICALIECLITDFASMGEDRRKMVFFTLVFFFFN